MAEIVVNYLLEKLTDAVFKEAVDLYGAKEKMESVERELRWIQCFLKDADAKSSKGNMRVQNWVKEVREVSFLIENAIDTFLFEVESLDVWIEEDPCILNILKILTKVPMKLLFKHNLNGAIDEIQDRLKKIKESRESYGINELGECSGGAGRSSNKPIAAPDADEIDLIGFDAQMDKIIRLLLDTNTSRRSVVSIVGQGGLGKTTLAEKIYQSVKKESHFDDVIWLTVSQNCKPITLLNKMLKKVKKAKFGENEHDAEYYKTECKNSLKNRRYFIVLDDVWEDSLWSQIQAALPNDNIASRVLITTRFKNIPMLADPKSDPCELPILNEEESLNLLLKKANVETRPADLLEQAKELSNRCGGLPLALVVVGGLLSIIKQTPHDWNLVVGTMDWEKDGKKCTDILASSYEDLPIPLKTCFIYLASFPEDWYYKAELIIRLWIAEGFIPRGALVTMKQIAETYLEKLAQRSMIQVTKINTDGSIAEFRVHDLLLNLAIREAKEKDFLVAFSNQNTSSDASVSRRASFLFVDSSSYTNSNVRTLFFFGKVVPLEFQFKLLRVLVICNYECPKGEQNPHWMNNIKRLLHLRCLVFGWCNFGENKFVLAIDNLHKLQTLEICGCEGIFVHIDELRYKNMENLISNDVGIVIEVESALVPNRTYKSDLFVEPSLSVIIKTGCWEQGFERAKELDQSHQDIKRYYLTLDGRTKPKLEMFDTESPGYISLFSKVSYLCLKGEIPNGVVIPPQIKYLELLRSNIKHDHMKVLGSSNIEVLGLYEGSYNGRQLICSAQCFTYLEKLEICLLEELQEWHIEDGAMPKLCELRIYKCPKLQMLPELQHLKKLEWLYLEGMPKEFVRRMQNEDRYKIEHIEDVDIKD